ncbi:S41 family peptidase [Urechidicola vernalis]|uniref:S41 family peptidase n=1 Tax=Urechidicola vernalis TaxID=3075600 RepID=A0ABU2Y142_9FLAO|nr:S41 family peptidase [Urechidicola sp. P050]MDT0551904.1 S41 family peptidase [Urechidicola sp. P050]
MKNIQFYASLIILSIFLINCSSDDDDVVTPLATPEPDPVATVDLEIENFIWKGLNLYYLWQQDVPDLSDTKFTTQIELDAYLAPYDGKHEELFENLLHNEDEFSWIVDDYNVLDQQLRGGVSSTTGMDIRLSYIDSNSPNLVAFVRYILPNSAADDKNIKRGDFFQKVDGQQLTINNYFALLFESESYTIELTDYNNGVFTNTGTEILLIKEELAENPVHIVKTIDNGSDKVGYIMYNQFLSTYDSDLNTAFGTLKAEGVSDLVLDLRYNSGGQVSSAINLSSMITGQFENEVFSVQRWNDKVNDYFTAEYGSDYFTYFFSNSMESGEAINNLNMNKVIILTSSSTASSSELVINGLDPYIEVILIGDTTVGKTWGSLTLYDSPDYTNKDDINPNHTWAMQPLVVETQNSVGYNNKTGFIPDYELLEYASNLGVLGDPNEPLLSKALEILDPSTKYGLDKLDEELIGHEYFTDSKKESAIGNNMFIELKDGFIK